MGHEISIRNDYDPYFGGVHAVLFNRDIGILFEPIPEEMDRLLRSDASTEDHLFENKATIFFLFKDETPVIKSVIAL